MDGGPILLGGEDNVLSGEYLTSIDFLKRACDILDEVVKELVEAGEQGEIEFHVLLDAMASHLDPPRGEPDGDIRLLLEHVKVINQKKGPVRLRVVWLEGASNQVNRAGQWLSEEPEYRDFFEYRTTRS